MTTPIIPPLEVASANPLDPKIAKLREAFPEVFTDGKVDIERLATVLGKEVETSKERYGLNWPWKSECFKTIRTPSTATLRPKEDESVNWDTTENVFIEWDNLEVLKLLQKSYIGKVKMIYIDPPYNTGSDFVYPDNYSESLSTYLEYTGQVDSDGKRWWTNLDTDGRFHSKWINMMYPRLFLAKNLLREDGVIFISIDDHEVHNLKMILDEIFGEENFITIFPRITKKAWKTTDTIAKNNDYVLCYRKSQALVLNTFSHTDDGYKYTDEFEADRWKYKLSQTLDYWSIQYSPSLDYEITLEWQTFRPWNVTREEMEERKVRNPKTDFCWRWSKDLFSFGLENGFIVVRWSWSNKRIYTKTYQSATIDKNNNWYFVELVERTKSATSLDFVENEFSNDNSKKDLGKLFETKVFDYSKPVSLIKYLTFLATSDQDIVLDFFAWSWTTAQSVFEINQEDGLSRHVICVQLPEPCTEDSEWFRAGYKTIADIAKERIRRAWKKEEDERKNTKNEDGTLKNPNPVDIGFRVFSLDTSNMRTWDAGSVTDKASLEAQLAMHMEHITEWRSEEDLLAETILKSGFPLSTAYNIDSLAGKRVYSIADWAMFACFEDDMTLECIRAMADSLPLRVVCLDSAFHGNDQLKTNAVEIMRTKWIDYFHTI